MAVNWTQETRSINKQWAILAAETTNSTLTRLSDQNVEKLGTNRRKEVLGAIGDTGESYQKVYNDYLDGL